MYDYFSFIIVEQNQFLIRFQVQITHLVAHFLMTHHPETGQS